MKFEMPKTGMNLGQTFEQLSKTSQNFMVTVHNMLMGTTQPKKEPALLTNPLKPDLSTKPKEVPLSVEPYKPPAPTKDLSLPEPKPDVKSNTDYDDDICGFITI